MSERPRDQAIRRGDVAPARGVDVERNHEQSRRVADDVDTITVANVHIFGSQAEQAVMRTRHQDSGSCERRRRAEAPG